MTRWQLMFNNIFKQFWNNKKIRNLKFKKFKYFCGHKQLGYGKEFSYR